MASGSLSLNRRSTDYIVVNYSFSGVPASVGGGNVYLNGSYVGSGSGSGAMSFDGLSPGTSYTFTLSYAAGTLAQISISTEASSGGGGGSTPPPPPPTPPPPPATSGTLSAEATGATTVSLNYSYANGSSVSLFRDSDKVTTFGSGSNSGVYIDEDLAPDTVYHYSLRNGDTIGSTLLAEATVGTPELPAEATIVSQIIDSATIDLTYSFNYGTDVSLFRDSERITTFGSGSGSGTYRDTGLAANTSYAYTLRNGTTSTDTLLASETAKTLKQARQTVIEQGRILPLTSMITIFDSTLTRIGVLEDYEYLQWTFRYRKPGDFKLVINRYKPNTTYLVKGNILALYVAGYYRAAIIESVKVGLTEEGKISENYEIVGRTLGGILAERIALHVTDSGTGYDSQDTYAETAMRHYVNVNCMDAVNTDRNYPLLYLETPDGERGGNVKYDGRFQYISEIHEEISLTSGLGWDIVLDPTNKKMVFVIIEGLDRSYGNGENSPVTFSPRFGNIRLLSYLDSSINSKNVVYVAGQGDANTRDVDEVTYLGAVYTGMSRREFLIDARDLDSTDKMLQRGNERLAELGEEKVIEIENLSTGPFSYGIDFYLGDIITIEHPEIVSADLRLIESVIEITSKELIKNFLVFGKTYPDLISINEYKNKNFYPEVRR